MRYLFLFCLFLLLQSSALQAQDLRWVKHRTNTLCGPQMNGRGYYKDGRNKAAGYLARQFQELGLTGLTPDSSYYQNFTFPVNTFPGQMYVKIGKQELTPGENYLIDARSNGSNGNNLRLTTVDFSKQRVYAKIDSLPQLLSLVTPKHSGATLLLNLDTICKKLDIPQRELLSRLHKGAYLIPQKNKLIWTVATDTISATVFYIADTALPKKTKKLSYAADQKFLPQAPSKNVMGYVPGTERPDSFIVFTAHYDHLGRMGHEAVFPGASDNASGTAMLLLLANYYAKNPQRYSIVFIAFAGEEAGLIGSRYFVNHPQMPLENIRFLTNIDIMGDATEGITVVNATKHPKEFALLRSINEKEGLLPEVRERGEAANSDHYFFSKEGVPAFFFYSNSGPGFYHDVYDKPGTISLNNFMQVSKLIGAFAARLMGQPATSVVEKAGE